LINHYNKFENSFEILFFIFNLKKNIDIRFKNGFIFKNLNKKSWKYLVYYLTVINKGIIINRIDNKIYANFKSLTIQLLDQINGIYQIKEIFLDESYSELDYNNKLVYDIGGFIGMSALYFILNGAKRVYTFEVNRESYMTLTKNIFNNELSDRIIASNLGISNDYKEDILNITEIRGSTGFHAGFSSSMNIIEKQKIKLVPFNSILKENIDILKIDCEGCEYAILSNILKHNLIDKINESIILEAHNLNEEKNPNYAKSLLSQIGFKQIKSKKLTKDREMIIALK
jgi:FkbM family methyltransferase